MLDTDLADIYGYEVKRLNEQVKRNKKRFLEDFMFQLTREEVELVKSQIATSRNETLFEGQDGGRRKLPYAFTEQGIYMLATVLLRHVDVVTNMILKYGPALKRKWAREALFNTVWLDCFFKETAVKRYMAYFNFYISSEECFKCSA